VSRPTILAIDADEGSLQDIEGELLERYRASYRVVCVTTVAAAEAFAFRGWRLTGGSGVQPGSTDTGEM
jgi:hypothetical protein